MEKVDNISILNKIIESKDFKNSKIYCDLLTYLVDCSIKDVIPKEISIAIDVFKKDIGRPKEDLNIRVYIYKLRKKLTVYYQNEGKKERIRLEIPKGHYQVRFVHARKKRIVIGKYLPVAAGISLIFIIIILLFQVLQLKQYIRPYEQQIELASFYKSDSLWSDLLASPDPIILTSSDVFNYSEFQQDINETVFIRNSNVNSEADLNLLKTQYPGKKDNKKTYWVYFSDAGTYSLPNIASIFGLVGNKFFYDAVSKVTMDDVKNNNVIFVGINKSLGVFEPLLRDSLNLQFFPAFAVSDSIKEKIDLGALDNYHSDMCVLIKVPTPTLNTWMFVISYRITGTMGVVHYITYPPSLLEFEQMLSARFGKIPKYFIAVFKVLGYDAVAYKVEVMHLQKIDSNVELW